MFCLQTMVIPGFLKVTQCLVHLRNINVMKNIEVPSIKQVKELIMFKLLSDPQRKGDLQVELAAVVDSGECFVKATYNLEGDRLIMLKCFEVLSTLAAGIQTACFPNCGQSPCQVIQQ